jgi:aminoglycoside phosphotransferase
MPAGPPDTEVVVPDALHALAAGRPLRAVWQNELGGLTFEVGEGAERRFVKWAPHGTEIDLAPEVEHLRWAAPHLLVSSPAGAVPQVLEVGGDRSGTWMATSALPGESAVSERWLRDPATAVRAVGEGLRGLHDALPVDDCPYSWSLGERLMAVEERAGRGELHPLRWHPDHQGLSVADALARLADAPPIDRLVVCHGDACVPNTIVDDDGRCAGHVDMGALGTADRWADLAVATWSTVWNYGPGWEHHLLDAYGIDPDPERTAYYRLLWDLGP